MRLLEFLRKYAHLTPPDTETTEAWALRISKMKPPPREWLEQREMMERVEVETES